MHPRLMLLAPFLAWTALAAQTPPAAPLVRESQQIEGRKNQKVERLHVEDKGVRIDEVRYGGQAQSIVVQPKGDMPEYEIQPSNLSRTRPADHRDGMSNATGARVWNFLKF